MSIGSKIPPPPSPFPGWLGLIHIHVNGATMDLKTVCEFETRFLSFCLNFSCSRKQLTSSNWHISFVWKFVMLLHTEISNMHGNRFWFAHNFFIICFFCSVFNQCWILDLWKAWLLKLFLVLHLILYLVTWSPSSLYLLEISAWRPRPVYLFLETLARRP